MARRARVPSRGEDPCTSGRKGDRAAFRRSGSLGIGPGQAQPGDVPRWAKRLCGAWQPGHGNVRCRSVHGSRGF
eukprot:13874219-Heterocapsa_arctica.AAC.1